MSVGVRAVRASRRGANLPKAAPASTPAADRKPGPDADDFPPGSGPVSHVACIDLGSNSFHLVIARLQNGSAYMVARRREAVQLAANVQTSGRISRRAFARGLQCLEHFQLLMKQWGVRRCWALGANVFRTAHNASDFIDAAARLGLRITVASGEQEARLIYAGVADRLPASRRKRLVVDIGGGSTEIIAGQGQRPHVAVSLQAGCVAWRDRFFAEPAQNRAVLGKTLKRAKIAAREVFAPAVHALIKHGWSEAFASSGTARMLAAVCREHGFGSRTFSLSMLQELRTEMLAAIIDERELPGLKQKRRDLLLPGCAVMIGLMQALHCNAFRFSPYALREGMLDTMVKERDAGSDWPPAQLPDVNQAGL